MADGKPRRHYSNEDKAEAIRRYFAGESPNKIISDMGIPKRTLFSWVQKAQCTKKDAHARDKAFDSDTPVRVQIGESTDAPVVVVPNYMERFALGYEYNRIQLQTAAINGYCEGMVITADLLQDALNLEDPTDRIYAATAVLKERRALSDRIIKAFADVATSSDEYKQIFGKLFNLEDGGQ